ncbi:hypothetical protein N431DRAFT_489314 [Stipitochalara longipes BDJ]|nr:hypothetical protein N431DRAFT_489314 [Stipitochalara longipes BDJ]
MPQYRPQANYNALEFVNVTDPLKPKDAAHRKTVRTHVMGRYWSGRKSGVKQSSHCSLVNLSSGSEKSLSTACRYGCRGRGYGELEQDGVTRMTMSCLRCGVEDERGSGRIAQRRFINYQVKDDTGDERVVTRPRGSTSKTTARSCEFGLATPHVLLGGGDRDPFSSLPIPTVQYTEILLRHWIINLSPVLCTLESAAKKTPNPVTEILIPLAISDAAMFYALIAFSSSLMDARSRRNSPSTTTLLHRGSAIRLLQESMNDKLQAVSDKVLATICLVSCSHIIFRDHPEHRSHVEGINQIVALRGGIETLKALPVIYWLVIWSDNFRSLYTSTAPQYKLSPCPIPHPALSPSPPPSFLQNLSPPRLDLLPTVPLSLWTGTSLFTPLTPAFLSLTDQIRSLNALISTHLTSSHPPTPQTLSYFHHQRAFIEYRLCSNLCLTSPSKSSSSAYEHCLFLAASLYHHVNLRPFCIWSGVQATILGKLQEGLERVEEESGWGGERELALWVLGTAACVEDHLRPWFVERVRGVMGQWEPRLDLDGVKCVLRGVLWCERTSGVALDSLFRDIGEEVGGAEGWKVNIE